MITSAVRAGLVLLVALSASARPDHLLGQESRSPMDALLTFVEEDVRRGVPREMRPYEVGRLFLRLDAQISDRNAIGPVEHGAARDIPVTLLDDTVKFSDMVVRSPTGAHVRDNGVYVTVHSVDKEADGVLAVTFAYYVTLRQTGRQPTVCWEERRITLRPSPMEGAGWEVLEAKRLGGC